MNDQAGDTDSSYDAPLFCRAFIKRDMDMAVDELQAFTTVAQRRSVTSVFSLEVGVRMRVSGAD